MKNYLLIIPVLLFCTRIAWSQTSTRAEIEAFAANTGAVPTIDSATTSLSFLRFPYPRALQLTGADAREKSLNFVTQYKNLFGLRPGVDELQFREQKVDVFLLDHVTLQQTYKGVPVWDGVMKFHYDINKGLTAVNGNYISGIKVNPVPTLAQHEAEAKALELVTAQNLAKTGAALRVISSTLYIFQKGLAQGYHGTKLLVYEVEVRNDVDVREFMYIDAHNGQLAEQFTGMHGIERRQYEGSIAPENLKWYEGGPGGSYDENWEWRRAEIDVSGHIYNMMKNAFGYVSYDNADAPMITVFNAPNIECPNATWNGVSANFCPNSSTDDVVAHEWAHAYTEYTSGLVSEGQAGAMNEAYSDIWGEVVDLRNSYMDDLMDNPRQAKCNSTSHWLIGEYDWQFGGARRDLYVPSCYGNPGKLSDAQYTCTSEDGGGTHLNSTVLSHAFALMGQGGTYNGQTIRQLGLYKPGHIFWRAQWAYMTKTTDFAAMADILEAAANDLIGFNLPQLLTTPMSTVPTSSAITVTDVEDVVKAINAVELRGPNPCGPTPLLSAAPALCQGASPEFAIYHENFESGLGGFTTAFETSSGSWQNREWVQATAPGGRSGSAAFGTDFNVGDCNASVQAGIIRMESPVVNIPADATGNLNLAFDHFIALEDTWDGGNIKYRINGGAWTLLPANAFTANAYNNLLTSTTAGNNNPLAGQPAFTGTDAGALTGSWGQSQVNLTSLGLVPGNSIQFRFELGTDGCGGVDGWYIDDLRVFTCANPAVHFATKTVDVYERQATTADPSGCFNYIDQKVTIQIDKAPTQPVVVTFNTPGGTAKAGVNADYTISPASVTLGEGALAQDITVRVYNDAYIEEDETIDLSYSINANGGDGHAAADFQTVRLTIHNDDFEPGNYVIEELYSTNFNDFNGTEGWAVIDRTNTGQQTWSKSLDGGLEPVQSPYFKISSRLLDPTLLPDGILESPVIDTRNQHNVTITFAQGWGCISPDSKGTVEVWDGTTWHILLTQDNTTPYLGNLEKRIADIKHINIPDEYTNAEMKVRFTFIGGRGNWWGIDNVKIAVSNSTSIMSAVNTGEAAPEYLGPNETAVFHDPSTGNVIAKIKNLSDHDYGCTTVEVDRAGANATPWLGTYYISNKTVKVTPATNNPNGQYEITLYYKASELGTFTPANIRSMGKSPDNIAVSRVGTTASVTAYADPQLNGDYAFTATFNTGFSGFGLSDAPPELPFPVRLVSFEGKHTTEGNLLEWTTSAESNNDYFAIEESTNGRNFMETGRVKGVGNASVINHYSFTDVDFNKGITYYRLKQLDFDGKYAYSRIVAVDAPAAGDIRFYPNPVQSALNVELPDLNDSQVSIRVINSSGQAVIVREKVTVQNGRLSVQFGKLPSGIYQILIANDKVNYQLSVFKL
jgi:Zn-dependent metalloprotease